jgi:uncharacterized alkaline shock family protein YloU
MEQPESHPYEALSSPLGRITIASGAVAEIVSRTIAECYGVVGTAPGLRGNVRRLLPRGRSVRGVTVSDGATGLDLDLNVVVEHGLNLAEIGSAARSRIAYEVERLTGLHVASVDVHIEDVRRSA